MDFREILLDDINAYYTRSREVELTEVFTANRYGFEFDTNSTYPMRDRYRYGFPQTILTLDDNKPADNGVSRSNLDYTSTEQCFP